MKRTIVILGLMLLAATAAQAHTHLQSSVPADKSKVPPPAAIELHFSQAARVTALSLQQGTAAAKELPLPAKVAKDLSIPVAGLTAGDYAVNWRVVGEDGHVMSGKFSFTVDPAAPAAKPASAMPMHQHDMHEKMKDQKPAGAPTDEHKH